MNDAKWHDLPPVNSPHFLPADVRLLRATVAEKPWWVEWLEYAGLREPRWDVTWEFEVLPEGEK